MHLQRDGHFPESASPPNLLRRSSLYDASSNSGDLPDMNSLLGIEAHLEKGDIKRHREKVALYLHTRENLHLFGKIELWLGRQTLESTCLHRRQYQSVLTLTMPFDEQNRAAQKRFRQRQKTRMATSAQQVQELANQMQALALEKQRLEAQNRVLQHTVKLSTRHIQDTNAEKVCSSSVSKILTLFLASSCDCGSMLRLQSPLMLLACLLIPEASFHNSRRRMPSNKRGSYWRRARSIGGA